jgi:putative aldouronate transport system substrate-binding protein
MTELPAEPTGRAGARLDRRTFMGRVAGLALTSTVGMALLEACAPAAPAAPTQAPPAAAPTAAPAAAATSAPAAAGTLAPTAPAQAATSPTMFQGVRLPSYISLPGPKPDLAGNAQGLDSAYFQFPSNLVKSVARTPGDGSDVSVLSIITQAAPPPMDQNTAWQAINKEVGATFRLTMVGGGDYPAKVNTVIAGADLPDFLYNSSTTPYGVIAALPQFARSKCADLTPYLSGDAIQEYPNLANYSTYSWRTGVVDGRIYCVPASRAPFGIVLAYRGDLFDQAGISFPSAPKDADEFKRLLVAVNRPQANLYGIATAATYVFGLATGGPIQGMFRAPTNWRLDASGKLQKDFETEEFAAAVGFARDLWAAGVYHPNTPTYAGGAATDADFRGGKFSVYPTSWGAYLQNVNPMLTVNPNARMLPVLPFAHDGGKPVYLSGSGHFGQTFITQQRSPERVQMLLRIMNFFAAPFGTEEWLLNYYGVRDVDYTMDASGAPSFTPQGRAELTLPWRYITSPPPALYDPLNSKDFATVAHQTEQAMLASIQTDPTLGLYSATAFNQGIPAQDTFYSGISEIVQARRPVSDLAQIVQDWRTRAGDKMRAEYQDQLASAKS